MKSRQSISINTTSNTYVPQEVGISELANLLRYDRISGYTELTKGYQVNYSQTFFSSFSTRTLCSFCYLTTVYISLLHHRTIALSLSHYRVIVIALLSLHRSIDRNLDVAIGNCSDYIVHFGCHSYGLSFSAFLVDICLLVVVDMDVFVVVVNISHNLLLLQKHLANFN